MENNKVKLSTKLGFLMLSSSENIVHSFKNMYYLTFLTMILQVDVAIAGAMLAVGTVWDAVNDPLVALFCANHKFKNGEKIRPYALYCSIPWAIALILLFTDFHLNTIGTVIVGEIVYFAFEMLYTFMDMPYNSMAALVTKSDEERKSINAYRSLGACVGTALGSVAILPLVRLFGGLRDHDIVNFSDAPALFKTAIIMGVICVIGALSHYFTSKEMIKSENEDEEKINIFQAYKMLFKCKSWVLNMSLIICYGIINTIVMQNINYYAAYVIGDSKAATPILAVYLVVALATSVLAPVIDNKLGRKKAMLSAVIVSVAGKIPFILSPSTPFFIYINALTIGYGMTLVYVIFNTNRNNIADILEVQNNRRIDTLVAGGDNLITKISEAIAIEVMSLALSVAGYNEALGFGQTTQTINTINSMLGWVPAIFMIIIAVFALKLDTKKELEESIAKKK